MPAHAPNLMLASLQHSRSRSYLLDPRLCNAPRQLLALAGYARDGHVLFGSDYPRTPPSAIQAGVERYTAFIGNKRSSWISPHKLRQNATSLLRKHKLPDSNLPKGASLSWRNELFGALNSPKVEQKSRLDRQGRQSRSEADAGRVR